MIKFVRANIFIFAILFSLFFSRVSAQIEPAGTRRSTVGATQVVVIASQPFLTDMIPGFSPAHLRLLLDSVRPDIIAVESPANIADSWEYAPFYLQKVVKPWAKERQIPLMPIGHLDMDYGIHLKAMLKHFENSKLLREYNAVEKKFKAASRAHKYSFKFINLASHDAIWRDYTSALHRLYRKNTPAEDISSQVAANIIKACNSYPGKRIAVIINAPISYYIKDQLADQPGIHLLNIENSLDFSQQGLTTKTIPEDYLNALRILRLDDFTPLTNEDLSLLNSFLNRIRQHPEYEYDYYYFRGKMLLRKQNARLAVSHFQNMVRIDPNILLKFDNKTPVRDSALVYIALAKLQMGHRKEALARLKIITKMPDVHQQTKEWIKTLLGEISPTDVTIEFE